MNKQRVHAPTKHFCEISGTVTYNTDRNIPQVDGLWSESDSSLLTNSPEKPSYSSLISDKNHEDSWFSQDDLPSPSVDNHIPVQIGFRPTKYSVIKKKNLKNNITIRRDDKYIRALSLPSFSVYNMRSVWSKFSSLAEDMEERATDFSILSEVWEKKENLGHKKIVEEMFELKDIQYFSTARPGSKRGGGAAIIARSNKFLFTKLNIDIPKPLEVVWAMLRPKVLTGSLSKIVICSFYSPPRSKKRSALIDHISITVNRLKILHPKASFIIAGDKNDLNDAEITSICPSFRQLVLKPTN